uniref:Uncharacterized protein n=1 Tax=Panagrolaimus superbus TaxID=310955 RepID=A0A914ZAU6_9BILA
MQEETDPKNVVSAFNAQYPFASYQQQQHHQQWKDNEFGTHFSSTPIYLYQSPPHFGNFDPISPITVNAYSGYGYMPDQYEYISYLPRKVFVIKYFIFK